MSLRDAALLLSAVCCDESSLLVTSDKFEEKKKRKNNSFADICCELQVKSELHLICLKNECAALLTSEMSCQSSLLVTSDELEKWGKESFHILLNFKTF